MQQTKQFHETLAEAASRGVGRIVAAELRRGCSEFKLLYACNEQAAAQLQRQASQVGGAAAELGVAAGGLRAVDELDAALAELERMVAALVEGT